MKHKGLYIFCAAALLIGIGITIAGFALGGRPGSIQFSNGQAYYYNGSQRHTLGSAPGWMRGNFGLNFGYFGYGDGEPPAASTPSTGGETTPIAGQVHTLDVDISAGYVKIVAGDEAKLTVDGDMPYTSNIRDGHWEISAKYDNIDTRWLNGWNRFFYDGKDITTTFAIVVPRGMRLLEGELSFGEMKIDGIAFDELDLQLDMGSLVLNNCSAKTASFRNNMGSTSIRQFGGDVCSVKTDMGSVDFEGSVTDTLEIDCSMGRAKATLPRPGTYSWEVEVGLGAVKLDGMKFVSDDSSGGSGKPYFDLTCDLGSIDVVFKN